ncbi:hypothetical protein FIU87_03390 [Bacillus sp. THAF10]|uniref:hypothetical protein n=1 Tax=Bacillus sp. THAF10 TaxID=2587848 RepID=UPI0012679628|nr:hypothetical protein [Bacillus sp. THAF10]QFT87686.1 hypothetical protein FIU87_03390 [Bacillus sp. THAF10]
MDRVMQLSLEDIGARYRTLIPVWLLGTGADFGELNPYARHLSFGLLTIVFYQELLDDLKRTRHDLIQSVKQLARCMGLECTEEEAEKVVDAIMVNAHSKKHTFSFQEQYYDEVTGKWETFRFQYLEVDRDVSDLDEGNIIYTLTSEAKELFLNTNEIQKQLPISIQQLLVELLIEKGDLKSALRMLESLNHRVLTLLKEEKIHKDELLRNPKETIYKQNKRWSHQLVEVENQFREEAEKYAKLDRILKKIAIAPEHHSTYLQITKRLIKTRNLHDNLAKMVIENIRIELEILNKYFRSIWLSNTTSFRKTIWEQQAKVVGFSRPDDMLDLVESMISPSKPSILPLEWGIDNQTELPVNTFAGRNRSPLEQLEPVTMDWESILLLWKPVIDELIKNGKVSLGFLKELDEFTLARWVENREAFDFWLAFSSSEEPFLISKENLEDENDDKAILLSKLMAVYPELDILWGKEIESIPVTETTILRNKVDVSKFILILKEEKTDEPSSGPGKRS